MDLNSLTSEQRDILRQRIDSNSVPVTESGCFIWMGCVSNGYGRIRIPNMRVTAYVHRIVCLLSIGYVPEDALICHHCDTRVCCNPAHVYIGSHATNINDAVRRGRHIAGFALIDQHGEKGPAAKLTEDAAAYIQTSTESGASLSNRFGVSPQTICDIRKRRTWRHLNSGRAN
jgi:hypothetical protein